ncbi:Two-component response regulator-like [Musa troglodytarum]|uniref:Two-component response regulator-like n=1 Tax=Musa troglodytarum TaxID=320322 RepID=A0A9E7FMX2_9LILI|nr:Two-component response regulator-like [Musa troglodytarum]
MGAREEREGRREEEEEAERFLPKMPVRVLLVEGDDSTRRIIAALLRKCSYRVAAASDGLKAWNTLKQNPETIDLVLSEVDLPSISGFGLLTMIMDHNTFKNIPVIMMSSHDSTSMVFKCMLKGAADFLTKPLRKNELRNLWQHVWRRQIVSEQDDVHKIQVNCDAKHKLTAHSGKEEHSTENLGIIQANKECKEQMSDAQSSCTSSDVEAESTEMELNQQKLHALITLDDGKNIQFDNASFANENMDDTQNECLDPNSITNGTNPPQCHHDITSKDLVDFIRVIDNQPQHVFQSGDSTTVQSGFSDIAVHDVGVMCKSNPKPHLELFLKRFEGIFPEKPDCDGYNTWNHSSSSAFSLYNSRPVIPTLLIQNNSGSRSSGQNCTEPLLNYKDSSENMEETKSPAVEPPVQCTPLRVIPLPLPVGSMPLCSGYDTATQHMIYQPSGHHFWSTSSSSWMEGIIQTNSLNQLCQGIQNSMQRDLPDENNSRNSSYHSAQKQVEHMELDEQRHASSVAGESVGSIVCNGEGSNLNISECSSVPGGTTGCTSTTNTLRSMTLNLTDQGKLTCEGTKPINCSMSQREMALNKFRLKRKDRCFEKKVRYHSRKLLAEQRPRVKGQFVRQAKLFPRPTTPAADGLLSQNVPLDLTNVAALT